MAEKERKEERPAPPPAAPVKEKKGVEADTDLDANKRRTDLMLADVAQTWTRKLTQDPANDTSPRWAPDGLAIYFLSTRSGSQQVWRLRLDSGRPADTREPPTSTLEIAPGKTLLLDGRLQASRRDPEELDERAASGLRPRTTSLRAALGHLSDGTQSSLRLAASRRPGPRPQSAMDAGCPSSPSAAAR
jgi:dipeptidyl aminopeptidase/acylaminoacyl peptidase